MPNFIPKISPPLIIVLITVITLWINFSRHDEIWNNEWRSNNISGYQFQEAPDYFTWLEQRKLAVLAFQEILILVSGLLVLHGLKKK